MANYDDVKQKVTEAVNMISDKAIEVYNKAAAKTKDLARQAQINSEIVREKTNTKKLLAELGSQYFAQYGQEPAEGVAQLCSDIAASKAKVAELQELLEEVKAASSESEAECTCGCECADTEEAKCECEDVTAECCEEEAPCCESEKAEDACCCDSAEASEAKEAPCSCGCDEQPAPEVEKEEN